MLILIYYPDNMYTFYLGKRCGIRPFLLRMAWQNTIKTDLSPVASENEIRIVVCHMGLRECVYVNGSWEIPRYIKVY
jgi:hypothetical protein